MDVSRGGCCVRQKKTKTLLIEITCLVDVNAMCEHTREHSSMRFENLFEQPNLSLTHPECVSDIVVSFWHLPMR